MGADASSQFSVQSHLDELMAKKDDLLADVENLAQVVDYQTFVEYNCQRAQLFFDNCLKQIWADYSSKLANLTPEQIKEDFPFKNSTLLKQQESSSLETVTKSDKKDELISCVGSLWGCINVTFSELSKLQALETIRDER